MTKGPELNPRVVLAWRLLAWSLALAIAVGVIQRPLETDADVLGHEFAGGFGFMCFDVADDACVMIVRLGEYGQVVLLSRSPQHARQQA